MSVKRPGNFFEEAGVIICGFLSLGVILYFLIGPQENGSHTTESASHDKNRYDHEQEKTAEVVPKAAVEPKTKLPEINKRETYFIQQARKRFVSACLYFEKAPISQWKSGLNRYTELQSNASPTYLRSEWRSLLSIVKAAKVSSKRKTASIYSKDQKQIGELREKFLRSSVGSVTSKN